MRKFLLLAFAFLAGCGVPATQLVKNRDLSSYRVLQESKTCYSVDEGESGECFSIAVLRGPDGNDYLKVDLEEIGKWRHYVGGWVSLCNLTALKESIERNGEGACVAKDANVLRKGIDHIEFYIYYNYKLLPLNTPDYKVEVVSYRDARTGAIPFRAGLKSHKTLQFGLFGIEWNRGKVRAVAKDAEGKIEEYGEWIDLTPYIPVEKAPNIYYFGP